MTGAELIAEERARQIADEGFAEEHDLQYENGELVNAAICYARLAAHLAEYPNYSPPEYFVPRLWPWAKEWWKASNDPMRNLAKAGALVAAEMDRMNKSK